MLSQIGQNLRTFLSSGGSRTNENNRKRSFDGLDDLDLTVKRPRHQKSGDVQVPESPLVRAATWVKNKQRSFCESYYYRKVVNSPKILMKKLSKLGIPEEIEAHTVNTRQYVLPQATLRMEQGPDMHFGSDIIPVHSTPMNNPVKGFNFTDAHFDLSQPEQFSFQGSPIEKYQFQAASSLPPRFHDSKQQLARPPIRAQCGSTNGKPGSVQKMTDYVSVYDKTYTNRQASRPRSRMRGHSNRHKMEAKESIRMEERKRYAELLQQFTTVPLTGTGFVASALYSKSVQDSPVIKDETLIGTQVTDISANQSTSTSKNNVLKKDKVFVKNKQPGLTDYTFVDPRQRARSKQQQRLGQQPDSVIDLTDYVDNSSETSSEKTISHSEPPVVTSRVKSPTLRPRKPTVAPFKKSLPDSKYVKDNWFQDIHEKYSINSRKLERQAREEEMKLKIFKEKREVWDKDLEKRIRYRLTLGERVPGIIEEPYEEEDTDDEEDIDEFPELTEEQAEMVDNALIPSPPDQKLVEGFRLELTRRDLQTLRGLNWLNDEVINFYMNLIMERSTLDNMPKVHAFNTFFYPKVMKSGQQSVRRWTKKVDLFAMDYIIVPVHLGMHWCLGIIDLRKKEICYYDSMGGSNNGCLNALRQYMMDESMEKKKQQFDMSDWKLHNMRDIPQQKNGSDCGMFACKFAEYVTRDAAISFTQEDMPYFRRRMVYEILSKHLV